MRNESFPSLSHEKLTEKYFDLLFEYPKKKKKSSVTKSDKQFKCSRIDENESSPNNSGKNRNTFLTFRFGSYFDADDAQLVNS